MNGTNGVKNTVTNYIEGFVGDENPEDIEVAIVACCIYDILKSHIGQPITDRTDLDIYTKLREFAEEYWRLSYTSRLCRYQGSD